MVLKIITGLLLKPILIGAAVLSFGIGAFIISEQDTWPLEGFIQLNGRDAVLFGTAILSVGVACIIFYLATWFFTLSFTVAGALLIVVGFGLGSADAFVSVSLIDGYIIEPVTGLINTIAKPPIDEIVKPILEWLNLRSYT